MFGPKTAHRVIVFLFFSLVTLTESRATTLYLEIGPGLSNITNAASIFNGSFTSGDLAFSTNAVFAYDSGGPLASFSFHLGVRGQWLSGLSGTSFGNLVGIYPMMRLEFYRFYIGAGVSPFSMYRVSTAPGFDSLTTVSGGLPLFVEGGLEWKMIPDFHLCFGATAHGAFAATGLTMFPSLEFSAQFRFLFNVGGGSAESGSASKNSAGKYDGWRYPFGIGKK